MFRAVFKSRIQKMLKKRGLKITHDRDDHMAADINLLDVMCQFKFGQSQPKLAVQVGANDGSGSDPFVDLIERYPDMEVILVEPLDPAFSALRRKYEGDSRVKVFQVAIDSTTGSKPIYRVSSRNPDNHRFSELASFDRATIEKQIDRIRKAGAQIIQEDVKTICVPDFLEQIGTTEIDVLQVDAEGYDASIVSQFLDAGVFPTVINFEHVHLTGRDDSNCIRKLRGCFYKLVRCGRDTIAMRSP